MNDLTLCWPETRSQNLGITHLVDPRGLHELPCCRSTARQQSHAQINDIIQRAILQIQTSSSKEPVGHNSNSNLTNTDLIKQGTSWTRTQRQ